MSTPAEIWQQIEADAAGGAITTAKLRRHYARATGWTPPEPFTLEATPTKPPKGYVPTLDEWIAYGRRLLPPFPADEAASAFDHFEANGWKIGGKAKMQDYQATCRNCHRTWLKRVPQTTTPAGPPGRPPRAI